ncbi:hypothetical protein Dimus_033751 [Dionaea muscipula]
MRLAARPACPHGHAGRRAEMPTCKQPRLSAPVGSLLVVTDAARTGSWQWPRVLLVSCCSRGRGMLAGGSRSRRAGEMLPARLLAALCDGDREPLRPTSIGWLRMEKVVVGMHGCTSWPHMMSWERLPAHDGRCSLKVAARAMPQPVAMLLPASCRCPQLKMMLYCCPLTSLASCIGRKVHGAWWLLVFTKHSWPLEATMLLAAGSCNVAMQ